MVDFIFNILNFRDAIHKCNLCDEVCNSFALFTKHINSDKHRSLMTKWIWLDLSEEPESSNSTTEKTQTKKTTGTGNIRNKEKILNSERAPAVIHQQFFNYAPPQNQYSWTNPNLSSYSTPAKVVQAHKELRLELLLYCVCMYLIA